MKTISLLRFFFLVPCWGIPVQAQTTFLPLPFDIEIGVTTNEEIENRGTCLERIQVSEYYFRCAKYSIQDRFNVYSSQNEIVTKLEFLSTASHGFPRDWASAGFRMGPFQREGYDGLGFYSYFTKNCEAGTSASELISILKSNNITYEIEENKAETNLWIEKECLVSNPQYKDITNSAYRSTPSNTEVINSYGGDYKKKSDIVNIKIIRFSVNGRLYQVKTAQWYHNFSVIIHAPTFEQTRYHSNVLPFFQKDLGIFEISVTEDY
ncbi:hypothetical protein [Gracilimonas sp.]|uniref:hypothetical protein n=1 Tax=Gracilimonas sp. TaxID=1974203 RepID=UPI0032EEB105